MWGVKAGNPGTERTLSLFASGQVGSREDGSPDPNLEAQVRLDFGNLDAVLNAAGCTFDDVVDITFFIVDPEANFETVWEVVPAFWGETPSPPPTAVGMTWLYGFTFEIKVVAKLPEVFPGSPATPAPRTSTLTVSSTRPRPSANSTTCRPGQGSQLARSPRATVLPPIRHCSPDPRPSA